MDSDSEALAPAPATAPRFTERDRQAILDAISHHTRALDKAAGPIVKADLKDLAEHVAKIERLSTDFIVWLREMA